MASRKQIKACAAELHKATTENRKAYDDLCEYIEEKTKDDDPKADDRRSGDNRNVLQGRK